MESIVKGPVGAVTLDALLSADLSLLAKTECNTVWACAIDGKLYALKGADITRASSLLNEKIALEKLAGIPGVPPLVRSFRDERCVYLLKRFASGCSVEKLFYAMPSLPVNVALHVVLQVAGILGSMHERGLVYRDLKANNVVLSKFGEVSLIDMGFATEAAKDGAARKCGAFHARAPEIVNGGPDSPAVDCWALGVLLWEMLTGKPPFGFVASDDELRGKLWETVPERLPQGVPEVESLLRGLLHTDPAMRLCVDGIRSHAAFATRGIAAQPRTFDLPEELVEEVEMQTLGMDEGVSPPRQFS
eukprot:TRINITY_DN3249_c0_g1_i2.p1 TRINITY_DN3249_c0_g1~~TRINITY_DN3249_c0_g1_i2.p1  ORF type:complete len:304 (+),score=99.41 TRINITY_DN3249_c0_g1_i2:73-984(+)